jgi:CheY-like chemotaxis protein
MTGAKILVVEDESITAMEIMQLLRTSGYNHIMSVQMMKQ